MESGNPPITVITGGSRGIGAATAIRLARAGHHLAVAYRDDGAAAERLVAAVTAQGVRCVTVRTDVAREQDVDQLFTIATQRLGPVTGLVNNAGLTAHIGDLIDTPVDVIRRVIEVNLVGVVLCARRAAQLMSVRRAGGGGAIVNVSSVAATLGSAHEYVHYAAAKAGVDALTVGLAKELAGDQIRVNAVAPGIVRTRIHADAGDLPRTETCAPTLSPQ
jgi:NAD(P)-dependent dehydrogenase (short-subunit alcohol dehydrogenase family)